MGNDTFELKLYSPITGHLMEDNWDEDDFDVSFYDYEGTPLSPYEMTAFEQTVHKAIEDEKMPEEAERGLMEYYSGHEPASVDAKVLSAFVDAEVYENKLWGVLKCTLKEPLTNEEIAALKEYASGQYSDGYGEGFEQRERKTEYGDLYVYFWNSGDDYSILTEQELKGPQIELRETFLAMNTVEYDTEVIETEGAGAQVGDEDEEEAEPYKKLIITVSVNSMDHLAGADLYQFTDDHREALAAMMEPQMLSMYVELIGVDLLGGFEGNITDIVSGLPVGDKGTEIVTAALTRLGHPYSQDYRGEGNYVDCSSLAQWAYRQEGISIPGTSVTQAQYCADRGLSIGRSELAPGDLVFWSKTTCDCGRWNEIHHVGIYIGNNRVIEASSSKGCVIVRELWGLGSGKWQVHSYGRAY